MYRFLRSAIVASMIVSAADAATLQKNYSFLGLTSGGSVAASVNQTASGGRLVILVTTVDEVSKEDSASRSVSLPGFTVPDATLVGVNWEMTVDFTVSSQASTVCMSIFGTTCSSRGTNTVEAGYVLEVPGSESAGSPVLGPPGGPPGPGSIFSLSGDVARIFELETDVSGSSIVRCLFDGGDCGGRDAVAVQQSHSFSIDEKFFPAYLRETIQFDFSTALRHTLSASCTRALSVASACQAEGSGTASLVVRSANLSYRYELPPDPIAPPPIPSPGSGVLLLSALVGLGRTATRARRQSRGLAAANQPAKPAGPPG